MFLLVNSLLFVLYLDLTFVSGLNLPARPTKGEVWPKPQLQVSYQKSYLVNPQTFTFHAVAENCKLLERAFDRYLEIINKSMISSETYGYSEQDDDMYEANKEFVGYLDSLNVLLMEPCNHITVPAHTMEEHYILNITTETSNSILSASTIWGILRGLETFSQLLYSTDREMLKINCTTIVDYPRFPHRGLMVDTSRHFIPVGKILKTLDAMSYNKLNVFHWHLTDDDSFPYQSTKYPNLSKMGAYTKSHVYSQSDVKTIIRFAAERGIRVIAEFDTPGHSISWGKAMPELLTTCYTNGVPNGRYGPIDPTKNSTYSFFENFFDEVAEVFPDQYLHLGADEVLPFCWKSNPNIKKFMKEHNIESYKELENYYIQKILNISHNLTKKPILWEDAFTNSVNLTSSTTVQIWKDLKIIGGWKRTADKVTKAGLPILLSACWYLDRLESGGDWRKFYNCEPLSFIGNDQQKALVLGGEACMWTEVVNQYNIESRVWPRASAVAEKLWSAENADTYWNAAKRLEEHACRMNKRGIEAQPPNGAGFCI
ncbi:hypothetical protein ILUMI_27398 [Ignelater luminosus]|uniref:Beta-hexosaminidase n=1 Tax=Ignelater luminosus TaxID=2038154 RepID=A0A8K0C557_IGNLU|nr:hypothetical protein ILUMI_27398 [Ignelater luminosus]